MTLEELAASIVEEREKDRTSNALEHEKTRVSMQAMWADLKAGLKANNLRLDQMSVRLDQVVLRLDKLTVAVMMGNDAITAVEDRVQALEARVSRLETK